MDCENKLIRGGRNPNYKSDIYLSLDDIIIKRGLASEGQKDFEKEVKQSTRDEGEQKLELKADVFEEFSDGNIQDKNVKISTAPGFVPVLAPVVDKQDVHLSLDDLIVKRGILKVPKLYAKKGPFTERNCEVDQIAVGKAGCTPKGAVKPTGSHESSDLVTISRSLKVPCNPMRQIGLDIGESTEINFPDQQFSEDFKTHFGQKRSFGGRGTGADVFLTGSGPSSSKNIKFMDDPYEELPEEEDDTIKDIIFGPSIVESAGSSTLDSTSALKLTRTISNSSAFNVPTVGTDSSITPAECSPKKPIAKAFVKNPFL